MILERFPEVQRLSEMEMRELAQELLALTVPTPPEVVQEMRQRMEEHLANPQAGVPLDEWEQRMAAFREEARRQREG
jgi:hypothetical protein